MLQRAYIKRYRLFFFMSNFSENHSSCNEKKKSERRKSMNDEKIVKHIHWGANNSY